MISIPIWGVFFFILLVPVLMVLSTAYWMGSFRRHPHYHLRGVSASAPHFLKTVASMSDSLMTQGQPIAFWSEIDAIQTARLELINQAQTLIQFETFMITPGRRAEAFADALCRQAIAGVTVQILADSYGAHELSAAYWQRLTQAGVDVRFFNPFSVRSPQDYLKRNHRKLLIIDQQVATVGGAGISDLWDGKDGKSGRPWYDFEVQWQGEVVGLLSGFFWQHWLSAEGRVDLSNYAPLAVANSRQTPVLITPGEDPTMGDSPIRGLFQLCILSAQKRLWIASPYLLPDQSTCKMLSTARQQGVDVRILTMGPKSDKGYVYCTSRERYGALLNHDIQIYEYQPSMMHGKAILIDHQWVSLGSANLDPRSFFHNDELNLCTCEPELLAKVEAFFEQGFQQSHRVNLPQWHRRPWHERFVGRLGNCLYWQL
ncbi:MAG: phosphatidylserine/phosphatidylglycerophosphate/cardiolipin synthase family protein [Leptolyngbyaceae cyanobacterium]